ncbi:prostate stem cell antigen-like [Megalops cyprinoides]|uniref:prostate stem cell antigen-like n=1 Tax=Megalops cyprinoides TaxID=118141 RepID=UPI001865650B|nr:prostate stem cell antigen-like [Megalops cyprinoides]
MLQLSINTAHTWPNLQENMRGLSFLLLFCLAISAVAALKCYVCSSTTTNEDCNQNTQTCQAPLDTCMTTVDISGNIKAIVKQCASAATCSGAASSASVDSNGNGNTVMCCNTQLCNVSGASTVRLHTLLLALPVCVLSVFLLIGG